MDPATDVPPYVARPLQLRPFQALMLAPRQVGDPSSARALARPYRDVADRLTDWIARGLALEDVDDALYLHEYTSGGLTVRGLVGALDVSRRAERSAERAVWPHEEVHPEQAGELADRMLQMRLNPAPILLVHRGTQELRDLVTAVAAQEPGWRYLDRSGQRQRVWAVRDPDTLSRIALQLADTRALLADGHHRYAAYLRLQDEHRGTPWDSGLAMLVDQLDTPLFIGAIHRVLRGADLGSLHQAAAEAGAAVSDLEPPTALESLDPDHLVMTDGAHWLRVRPPGSRDTAVVAWLHQQLLPRLDGRVPELAYHHSVEEAVTRASRRSPAVLLPSPAFRQVQDLVESGGLLPEKATSFQPKPSLGALMRPVRD